MKSRIVCVLMVLLTCFSVGCKKGGEEPSVDLRVTTKPITGLTAFSAKAGGTVAGGEVLSDRGICWGTDRTPTVAGNFRSDIDPVIGDFDLKITGIDPETLYYVRAYATTASGETVYGESVEFSTPAIQSMPESNSYLTNADDVVVIPVSRANKSLLGTQINANEELKAELLWMDNFDIVESVFVHGKGATSNVVVLTGNVEGNAVVVLKDSDGDIKWSWHIWVVQKTSAIGTITMSSGAKLMDRNLGAVTTMTSEIGAVGLQYQFGRKDPFKASESYGTPSESLLFNLIGGNPEIAFVEGARSLQFTVANPLTFIKTNWVDWSDQEINDWWKNEFGTKTLYDPCPVGWKIPVIEDYDGLSDAHFNKEIEGGHTFIYDGQSNYFPFTGYREVNGLLDATGIYGTFWANGAINEAAAFSPSYGQGGTVAVNGAPRSRALCIRCIKE